MNGKKVIIITKIMGKQKKINEYNKLRIYEIEKEKIKKRNLSADKYQEEIKKICQKLKI